MEQVPVRLELFLDGPQAGPHGVELCLDGRNVKGFDERFLDDFPRRVFDLCLIDRCLAFDVVDLGFEALDPGVNAPHYGMAQKGTRYDHRDNHIEDADAGGGPLADTEVRGAGPDEQQRREDEQDGCEGKGVLPLQRRMQQGRELHLGDGVLELADCRAGSHDVRRGPEPVVVQREQQRHQEQRGEEPQRAAHDAGDE